MPNSRISASAAGFAFRTESGPASIVKPSTRSVRISPPARDDASNTRTVRPRRANSYAAERPAIPAPTMATSAPNFQPPTPSPLQLEPVHVAGERLHAFEGRLRQDAMTEIEDVSGTAAGAQQDLVGGAEQAVFGTEQP